MQAKAIVSKVGLRVHHDGSWQWLIGKHCDSTPFRPELSTGILGLLPPFGVRELAAFRVLAYRSSDGSNIAHHYWPILDIERSESSSVPISVLPDQYTAYAAHHPSVPSRSLTSVDLALQHFYISLDVSKFSASLIHQMELRSGIGSPSSVLESHEIENASP